MRGSWTRLFLAVLAGLALCGLLETGTALAAAELGSSLPAEAVQHVALFPNRRVAIKAVTITNEDEIKLQDARAKLAGREIQIVARDGETLTARYNPARDSFMTLGGKKLIPGVVYRVRADWANIPEQEAVISIPNVVEARQVAPNQIALRYDRPVDMRPATRAGSYWVRNNLARPSDIASIGMNDQVMVANALTPDRVTITPRDGSGTTFLMTFTVNATPGVQYTVIPCFMNPPGKGPYLGGNYSPASRNTFVAR